MLYETLHPIHPSWTINRIPKMSRYTMMRLRASCVPQWIDHEKERIGSQERRAMLQAWLESHGIRKQADAARWLHLGQSTVSRWLSGASPIYRYMWTHVCVMAYIYSQDADIVVPLWEDHERYAFGVAHNLAYVKGSTRRPNWPRVPAPPWQEGRWEMDR